ncbi:hypothetical protein K435DRAFT_879773 [Dendrothele bispora CBS 962.96]|uniref:Uncharacterized protein n=1 Tax=Dendrothele bispora (strain CBS 962.96) TaxID=1314807 RepID=A0A4S8KKQ3_DENBC|nr:hypothetical protein K435DRAFT_879773 [Dendrothele bispora CBS 962.96]
MEVDSPYLQYFDSSDLDVFPWRDLRPAEIQQRRALLGGFLLYDVLLQCGSIREADLMYPPLDSATIVF